MYAESCLNNGDTGIGMDEMSIEGWMKHLDIDIPFATDA